MPKGPGPIPDQVGEGREGLDHAGGDESLSASRSLARRTKYIGPFRIGMVVRSISPIFLISR